MAINLSSAVSHVSTAPTKGKASDETTIIMNWLKGLPIMENIDADDDGNVPAYAITVSTRAEVKGVSRRVTSAADRLNLVSGKDYIKWSSPEDSDVQAVYVQRIPRELSAIDK